jgi:hypothetical protein
MNAWDANKIAPGSAESGWPRQALATLLLLSGPLSLFFYPLGWQLLVIYVGIGTVAGFLQTQGQLSALLALVLIIFSVEAGPSWLNRLAPDSIPAWWQPGLLILAGLGLVYLLAPIGRRHR